MPAYEIPNLRFSGVASGVIARRRFVTIDSNEEVAYPAAGKRAVGATLNNAEESGQILDIADGIVIVEAAESINPGVAVTTDANGKAVAAATASFTDDSASSHTMYTDEVAGEAITAAGASGELLAVKLT